MKTVFTYKLDNLESEKIVEFCNTADFCAIEQRLGFPEILYNTKINYFFLMDETGAIRSFSQINEKFRFAHVWFGPVCDDVDLTIESVKIMADYYRRRGFWYIGIQPYRKTGFESDYIEYKLNSHLNIDYLFNTENTKASLEIDLSRSMEEIFSAFSKGHRSAVKKAQALGITVSERSSVEEWTSFMEIYLKMCAARKISNHTVLEMERICGYLEQSNTGKLLLVKDADLNILGGSVFAYQGISVRYLLSASDPERRDIPVSHLAIYKAIEEAKSAGFRYFDLWGYSHFTQADDQVYLVNRFKKGFGGYFTFFMKKMNISLKPGGFRIYNTYNRIKKRFNSLKNILFRGN